MPNKSNFLNPIKYIVVSCSLLLVLSCNKDKITLPTISILPLELVNEVEPEQVFTFTLDNLVAEAGVSRIEITESRNAGAAALIFDSIFDGTNTSIAQFNWFYTVPNDRANLEVTLVFKIFDKSNNIGTASRRLISNSGDSLLPEIQGLMLYSQKSAKQNAYLIESDSLTHSDSTFVGDIDILCADTADELNLIWTSPKENKFVKFNSFNYDSASYQSMRQAYLLGVERPNVINLTAGDVIITKLNSPENFEYALIKITNVVDDVGSVNDRYEFNIKK